MSEKKKWRYFKKSTEEAPSSSTQGYRDNKYFKRGRSDRAGGLRRGSFGGARGLRRGRSDEAFNSERPRLKHPPGLKGREIGLWYAAQSKEKRLAEESDEPETSEIRKKKENKRPLASVLISPNKKECINKLLNDTLLMYPASFYQKTNTYEHLEETDFKHEFLQHITGNVIQKLQTSCVTGSLYKNDAQDKLFLEELEQKESKSIYRRMQEFRQKLPSMKMKDTVLDLINQNQVVVISGETGCGKTTQVAQFILDDYIKKGRGSECKIVCTQPRRISAIAVAERVAQERDEGLGKSVGYQIRLEKKMPRDRGSILYCTAGVLLKYMETNPSLSEITHVILDEIHERSVTTDFLITVIKDVIKYRSDIKIILMSATLNSEAFSKYYNNAPHLNIPGFTYPVEEYFLEDVLQFTKFAFDPDKKNRKYSASLAQNVKRLEERRDFIEPYIRELKAEKKYDRHVINELEKVGSEDLNLMLIYKLLLDLCKMVLTANIGTLLDLYGVEKGLEHFRSTPTLSFDQYKYYLQNEVFSSLPAKLPLAELREYESRIAEVCWLVCRKRYLHRDYKVFTDEAVFQLYRIFCVLAELVPDSQNEQSYQLLLHPSEVCSIAQNIASSLGCIFDEEDFTGLSISMGNVRLTPFIAVLESRCLTGIKDEKAIGEAITDIYQKIVEDVIKKGYLTKRGYIFPTMREFWFVLRPSELTYFKSRSEKDKCGALPIEVGSRVEATSGYRIILHTSERNFELGAPDHMTRLQWISALQLAADHSGGQQTYQRLQAAKRRLQRQGRIQEMIQAKTQLQQERSARQAAEGQAKELEALVKEDSKKLGELAEIKVKLEKLLEEETQAKRDEEIVRALQARVLAEEWEKREELERLQEEQKMLLDEERIKRKEYEERQREKEKQLRDAEERLAQLEKERQALDEELKQARVKIVSSEGKKDFLESKLYHYEPVLREGERVRRAHSFIPSTKERPVLLEVRSSTLRRPTKN